MIEQSALQEIILAVDTNTKIIGEAPQFILVNGIKTDVTSAMPYWSIQKVMKVGARTIIRSAEGDEFHNKVFDDWASYTY